ncbi:Transketolase [Planctomycetes bacterium Pla163]|uniref:Transketolase n=1 Tax=Rohdeia mirabilis TaxID=2528008 RepID=A0A518D355_9BACT|nr:Transketolase [Planctomycetes bacterium Pla163]
MSTPFTDLDRQSINVLRGLAIDAIEAANSGHPGLPLGAAPMAYVLWTRHLVHNPRNPGWADRDRFVLSPGHGSMLLYGLLHLAGYDLSLDELRAFRQKDSRTPGHPEFGWTVGVEAITGPLGQGSANAAGMAVAESYLAQRYNRSANGTAHTIVDHTTYALVSDGDLMEGLSAETASLAGHLGLGKLVYLWDDNRISLDGPTSMTFTEDVPARYRACGWHVEEVADGDTDLEAIDRALAAARAETERPSLICVRTTIGYGSPNKSGKAASHGAPLGGDEAAATKRALGLPTDTTFHVPAEVAAHFGGGCIERGEAAEAEWNARFEAFSAEFPDLAAQWHLAASELLPAGWDEDLPTGEPGSKRATRESGGDVLNALAQRLPWLMGGDADLSSSTKTFIKEGGSFSARSGASEPGAPGRTLHYGVREHAMAAMANGIAYHGGLRTFTATFFCFADYMRPAMRLAAMGELPVTYVFTHDSIALGEDGPTHQPVEHLASLRAMPNLVVLRPADSVETAAAWRAALARTDGPTVLVLSRQGLPRLERELGPECTHLGAYVLAETDGEADVTLIATGSEVELALAARAELAQRGLAARVVSMPSWELFEATDAQYRRSVLGPDDRPRVSIEAASTFGWERWLGARGLALGLDRFGGSAPASVLLEEYGFTATSVADRVEQHTRAQA